MLTSGDIVEVHVGGPQGSEAGMTRPAVTVTAQRIVDAKGNVGSLALAQMRDTLALIMDL